MQATLEVEATFALDDGVAARALSWSGHLRGQVVITVPLPVSPSGRSSRQPTPRTWLARSRSGACA